MNRYQIEAQRTYETKLDWLNRGITELEEVIVSSQEDLIMLKDKLDFVTLAEPKIQELIKQIQEDDTLNEFCYILIGGYSLPRLSTVSFDKMKYVLKRADYLDNKLHVEINYNLQENGSTKPNLEVVVESVDELKTILKCFDY